MRSTARSNEARATTDEQDGNPPPNPHPSDQMKGRCVHRPSPPIEPTRTEPTSHSETPRQLSGACGVVRDVARVSSSTPDL